MTEVRWCTACCTPSAVSVRTVHATHQTSMYGLSATSTTTRQSFRCQMCGAKFELRPTREAITSIVIGAVLFAAVTALEVAVAIQSLNDLTTAAITFAVFAPFQLAFGMMIGLGVRRHRMWTRHRIVVDAPAPAISFPGLDDAPAARRCSHCGGAAPVTSTTKQRVQGIPMGTTWTYRCGSCEQTFTLSSTWGSMIPELIVLTLIGSLIARMVIPDFETWWWGVALGLVAILVSGSVYRARIARNRHPLVIPTAIAKHRIE